MLSLKKQYANRLYIHLGLKCGRSGQLDIGFSSDPGVEYSPLCMIQNVFKKGQGECLLGDEILWASKFFYS